MTLNTDIQEDPSTTESMRVAVQCTAQAVSVMAKKVPNASLTLS